MARRKISNEIKQEAIRLVEEHGVKHAQVVRELGIGRSTLEKWLKEYRTSVSNGLTVNEKAELKRLRVENRELKIEKELLKKATVYFAKHSG
jgi:transposase